MKKRIYLDSAAAHPVRASALGAFSRASKKFGNPSAPHQEGQSASALLEEARTRIARQAGAKPDAVIFTSGATESNALGILGPVLARIDAGAHASELEVLYGLSGHASVIGAVEELKKRGVKATPIPLREGNFDLQGLAALLTERTALVTADVICGETGTRFDTRAVKHLLDECEKRTGRRPLFHVDATQVPLVELMDRTRLSADLISFDAQKIGGVRGIGALIAPSHLALAPLVQGGGQERGLRSGTPVPALALAFAEALDEAAKERDSFAQRARSITTELAREITERIPRVVVNGGALRAPHILNISFLGRDTDYLAALLDEDGFAVATRSACETDAEGSRVVLVQTVDAARASSTLRISLHAKTSKKDIRAFMQALLKNISFLDSAS